jgi:Protein of unknown function (DUF2695)
MTENLRCSTSGHSAEQNSEADSSSPVTAFTPYPLIAWSVMLLSVMFCPMEPASDDELISSIALDVMTCLIGSRYFEKLDDVFSHENSSSPLQKCDGTYKLSVPILLACGFAQDDLEDIFAVLKSRGGFCDCEVLYNVAEFSRLKAEYWRGRVEGPQDTVRHLDK